MPSSLIIGAGMTGLTAARELTRHGWNVVVLDKGRGVGGRMATRRMEQARLDHGAQYFSARTPEFQRVVQTLLAENVIGEWHLEQARIADTNFDHPQYIGVDGMSAVAKALARNLTVLTAETVVTFRAEDTGWLVETESGGQYRADSLLITIPAPQALALVQKSGYALADANRAALSAIAYRPCIAVMVALNQPSHLPAPGVVHYDTGDVGWVADNTQKGISPDQPSVTIHASADFSRAHFDDDLTVVGQQLIDQLSEWIPAGAVSAVQVHRWRYSLAEQRHPDPFLEANAPFPLLFGGDGFGAGNVEGAFTSGLRMAEFLTVSAPATAR
ncbi:NAD(P)/FAD-dependent oxidoreductase [Spirosoma arcticum]